MTSYCQANSHAKLDQHKPLKQSMPTACETFLPSSGLCLGLTFELLADRPNSFHTSLIELPIYFVCVLFSMVSPSASSLVELVCCCILDD